MELPNYTKYYHVAGIYYIINLINNKKYVGGTIDIYSRIKEHRKTLRLNTKVQPHLQKEWNEFGSENFDVVILELCNKDELASKEQYWLDKMNSLYPNGYNIRPNVKSNIGTFHTEESKARMREIMKTSCFWRGKKLPPETLIKMSISKRAMHLKSPQAIKVGLYDIDNNLISTYDSMMDAARKLNISVCCISRSITLNYKTRKGLWKKIA